MKNFKTSDGIEYSVDSYGVIHQLNPVPFKYDENYCATYDTPGYLQQSELLQALRLGFVIGALGRVPFSIIDNGYGNGAFLKFAKKIVPKPMGYDVTRIAIDDLEVLDERKDTMVHTFWDCLEHIPDLSFLWHIDASLICVSLPHCHFFEKGLDWFDTWHHRKPNEHLHHFNAESLKHFMEANGWRLISYSHHEDIVRRPKKGETGNNILSMAFRRKK